MRLYQNYIGDMLDAAEKAEVLLGDLYFNAFDLIAECYLKI